jgi:citryl-CoA lyase
VSDFWKTSISQVRPNEILVRGYPIEELTARCTFGDVVYLLLTGELPTGNEGRLVEAILVACCEHSLASPSVDAVRFVASSGVPLQTAVAAGVSSIGDVHGGAIEPCAHLLKSAVERGQSAQSLLEELKREKRRMPGFGHALHTRDPRAPLLFQLAEKWRILGPHSKFVSSIEAATREVFGKPLAANVDGAIAGLMCDLKIDPALGKAFFIIGRSPGYIAHAYEQTTAERPFKAARYDEITYTGPERRSVPLVSDERK